MKKIEFKEKELENMIFLYKDKKKSLDYISKIYNCSDWVIIDRLRKMNIKIRRPMDHLIGNKLSEETKKKISISHKGEKNGMWVGDNIKYRPLHQWITNNKPKRENCEICNKKEKLEIANINPKRKYTRNINDYKWLCRTCHVKLDKDFEWFNDKKFFKGIIHRNNKWAVVIKFRKQGKWVGTYNSKEKAMEIRKKEVLKIRNFLLKERYIKKNE